MVIAPARRAGGPGSIPGPGENFSLKLLIFADVFDRLHGMAVLNVAMCLKLFEKPCRIWNNPTVVNHEIVSFHFLCGSTTVIIR